MQTEPQVIASAPAIAQPNPAAAPSVELQPQWRPGMTAPELALFREVRDKDINERLERLVRARRDSNFVPRGQQLINPLGTESRVTSLPSESRWHPTEEQNIAHTGLDFVPLSYDSANPPPVYAASSGIILYVGRFSERAGEFVMMLDDDNRIVSYAHLVDGSTQGLRAGDRIEQGLQLGLMGNTGPIDALGNYRLSPHMHLGVRELGEAGRMQSMLAQATQAVSPNPNVQLMSASQIEDPAFNYAKYDVVSPSLEGVTFSRRGQLIPAPSSQYALVARTPDSTRLTADMSPQAVMPTDTNTVMPDGSTVQFPPGVTGGLNPADPFAQPGPGNYHSERSAFGSRQLLPL